MTVSNLFLFKRPNGFWYILYTADGRRQWKSTRCTERSDALKKLTEFKDLTKKKLPPNRLSAFTQERNSLFAGDCNFVLPGELSSADRITSPTFVRVSRELGATLDSRYTELAPNPISTAVVFLARFGIGIRLRADNVFASQPLAKSARISCHVLPDRVSDHSPVEIILQED